MLVQALQTPKYCMWKRNGRQAHQKHRPGAVDLCGQSEGAELLYHLQLPGNRTVRLGSIVGPEDPLVHFFDGGGPAVPHHVPQTLAKSRQRQVAEN